MTAALAMSRARRAACQRQVTRRAAEQTARLGVVEACREVQSHGLAVVHLTRRLELSERTLRRWRHAGSSQRPAPRGRPPHWAAPDQRNLVYQFLHRRGSGTPLSALRASFPQLRRSDLQELMTRFHRSCRRKARRYQSRLEWRRPGTVWAADFKERREPLEGRYGWLLSVRDLASRYQLAWLPVVEASAETVAACYRQLFAQHGAPWVLKSDNGGPFRAEEVKCLLAEHQVLPLYSPVRRPQYNGGVERANGQLAGYQEAEAKAHARPAGPTCQDAEAARHLANELSRPQGWRGPTSAELWADRAPGGGHERAALRAAVATHRAEVRAAWGFAADAELTHHQAAAVDRRAIRDALVEQGILAIHPRRRIARRTPAGTLAKSATRALSAGRIELAWKAAVPDGAAPGWCPHVADAVHHRTEEARYSTNNSPASGQNYG
jgi:hypothetical protein